MSENIYFTLNCDMFAEPQDVPVLTTFSLRDTDMREDAEECFYAPMPENMLNLQEVTERDFRLLCDLFRESPLYRVQLVFALDRLLIFSRDEEGLYEAVKKAFHPMNIPAPIVSDRRGFYDFEGGLFHPFLDEMGGDEMVQVYLNCVADDVLRGHPDAAECLDICAIVKVNAKAFLNVYNGFMNGDFGCTDVAVVLPKAARYGHDVDLTMDTYAERGHKTARAMAFSDMSATLEAWLYADHFQAELCRFLDIILLKYSKAYAYKWVKNDVFRILEREAMKQVFAAKLKADAHGVWADLGTQMANLRGALENNAENGVDPHIQRLLSQILAQESRYAGSGKEFMQRAAQRYQEYKDSDFSH